MTDDVNAQAAGVIRFMLAQLDLMVADRVPSAVMLAEHIREAKAAAWDEGYEANDRNAEAWPQLSNPYRAES